MAYTLYITPAAYRQLKKLAADVRKTIRGNLEQLCAAPFKSNLDVRKLAGREAYRLRVGDYRMIYRMDNKQLIVEVLEVGYRREIY